MPFDTDDGLAEIKWDEHYAYAMNLFQSSPIFETRNPDLHAAFAGQLTQGNSKYFDNFQAGLRDVPRLAVSGSDAHCFVGTPGDNNKRGYGDFPSGKKTWIKADSSFSGLKQAILEPAKRSFIGDKPPKLQEVESNKTYYIESIEVNKTGSKDGVGQWLADCDILLNPDLVAIIGNKGSGKSALADADSGRPGRVAAVIDADARVIAYRALDLFEVLHPRDRQGLQLWALFLIHRLDLTACAAVDARRGPPGLTNAPDTRFVPPAIRIACPSGRWPACDRSHVRPCLCGSGRAPGPGRPRHRNGAAPKRIQD